MNKETSEKLDKTSGKLAEAEEIKDCYLCKYWEYTDHIVRKYGEGTGYCKEIYEPTGCNRKACLRFERNTEI